MLPEKLLSCNSARTTFNEAAISCGKTLQVFDPSSKLRNALPQQNVSGEMSGLVLPSYLNAEFNGKEKQHSLAEIKPLFNVLFVKLKSSKA